MRTEPSARTAGCRRTRSAASTATSRPSAIIEAQDREIAEKSGLPPSRIKSLRRTGSPPSKEEKHEMKKAARGAPLTHAPRPSRRPTA